MRFILSASVAFVALLTAPAFAADAILSGAITTASGDIRSASSTASRPFRARPTTLKRPSCSSRSTIASRKASSSSATRIRMGLATRYGRVPAAAGRESVPAGERLLEVGPEGLGILEADAEAEQSGRDAVAFPAVAALDQARGAA